jgi:hypothetical protein
MKNIKRAKAVNFKNKNKDPQTLDDIVKSTDISKYTNLLEKIKLSKNDKDIDEKLNKLYISYEGVDINDEDIDVEKDENLVKFIIRERYNKFNLYNSAMSNIYYNWINTKLDYDIFSSKDVDTALDVLMKGWLNHPKNMIPDDSIFLFQRLYNKCSDELKIKVLYGLTAIYDNIIFNPKLNMIYYDILNQVINIDDEPKRIEILSNILENLPNINNNEFIYKILTIALLNDNDNDDLLKLINKDFFGEDSKLNHEIFQIYYNSINEHEYDSMFFTEEDNINDNNDIFDLSLSIYNRDIIELCERYPVNKINVDEEKE